MSDQRGNAWHEFVTMAYYAAEAAQQDRCDQYANGYPAEEQRFYREVEPRITFKQILIDSKGYANHE